MNRLTKYEPKKKTAATLLSGSALVVGTSKALVYCLFVSLLQSRVLKIQGMFCSEKKNGMQ